MPNSVQNLQTKINKELGRLSKWMFTNIINAILQKSHGLIINPSLSQEVYERINEINSSKIKIL